MWAHEKKIAAWFIFVAWCVFLVTGMLTSADKTSKESFEVISSYEGCDLVKYTDESQRWHYFLKCAPETYETHTETGKNS
jgi:hypothetical protein